MKCCHRQTFGELDDVSIKNIFETENRVSHLEIKKKKHNKMAQKPLFVQYLHFYVVIFMENCLNERFLRLVFVTFGV